MSQLSPYRGQWGGKIENGEEMWWSEPNARLSHRFWDRLFFFLDVRQHFIIRFFNDWKKRHPKFAKAHASPTVADMGCGTGGVTLNFSNYFRVPVIGLDVFETQLGIAREFAAKLKSPCTFRKIEENGRFPLEDRSLDALMSLDVLGHVPNIPATLRECARALKPGASFFLFTESAFSNGDLSIGARLARRGANMMDAVPEHISLFPREALEAMFAEAGFEVRERFSANVWHFFFFPKDYVLLLKDHAEFKAWYRLASVWNRLTKISPFYPWPFQFLRLTLTLVFGKHAYGSSYFYHLVRQ